MTMRAIERGDAPGEIGLTIAGAFDRPRAAHFGVHLATPLRAPLAHTVVVGLERDLAIHDEAGRVVRGRAIVVPRGIVHRIDVTGLFLLAMVHAEDVDGGVVRRAPTPTITPVEKAIACRLIDLATVHRNDLERSDGLASVGEACAWSALRPFVEQRAIDRRVLRVARALTSPSTVDEAAGALIARTGISRAHFRDLFARDFGLSLPRWLLWRRLLDALVTLREGGSASRAAIDAGFSDAAHLTRTCTRFLGTPPSRLRPMLAPTGRVA
jgi:AraC-like DNA-binding protein